MFFWNIFQILPAKSEIIMKECRYKQPLLPHQGLNEKLSALQKVLHLY